MDELMQFLRDRLDEDESVARTAGGGSTDGLRWLDHGSGSGLVSDDAGMVVTHKPSTDDEHAAHIARHDPARVLREVEAKRSILAQYEEAVRGAASDDWLARDTWRPCLRILEPVVRLLVLPYADHPNYQDTWQS
ncbi:DUF6221 family protein [Streptomyces sp. ML-6]|uniref:DUF6221 family protein n=1 Tax=unclassified Streptomyces TaxID=2593676 RepID=UPI0024BF8141|nr:DUF6221 family protein [Streptomyces sp. ML-6]MDK0524324.1 DUF6221 family protein [Streptomyces sp. ML-6]